MNFVKNLTIVFIGLSLTACVSTSVDNKADFLSNPSYKRALTKAEIMPTKGDLAGKALSVLILPTESKNDLALKSKSGVALHDVAEHMLQKSGLNIVQRKVSSEITDELKAYESTGKYNQEVMSVADVVMAPVISTATFSHTFTEGHTVKDIITGKKVWVDPSCRFKSTVKGYIKTFDLPNVKLRNNIELDGVSTSSRDTRGASCKLSTVEMYGMLNEASSTAVRNYRTAVQNQFAPKAYVTEHRVVGDIHYIKISLGTNKQIHEGNEIQFVQQMVTQDDLTGETSIDKFPVGTGEVTDIIQQSSSWVVVDAEVASKLHLGDVAVVTYTKNWMEHIKSVEQAVNSL